MPGIIGFPQLDPGFVGGSRPPEPEEEPATSPEPMPTVPDPAVQDYENNLYHRLGLTPPNQTDPPSSSQPTEPALLPVDTGVQDYENNLYHRLGLTPPSSSQPTGQASSSDSGGQGKTGSSQTEDAPGTGQAAEDTSAQAPPPEIAEHKDDFGGDHGMADSISPEGLYACGNVDMLLVKQDMETRPLTFSRCFEQFPTPRIACEFLYAEVPNCSDSELAMLQEQVAMGGGSDDENGQDSIGSGSDMYHAVYVDEEYLDRQYGIKVVWGDSYSNTQASSQINNLAKAVDLIVNYLTLEVFGGDRDIARTAFKQYLGNLEVHLGADAILADSLKIPKRDAVDYAIVPLYGSTNQKKMFLGSDVYISTIAHEFGHVIDLSTQVSRKYDDNDDGVQRAWIDETQTAMNDFMLTHVIEGFAAKQIPTAEIWADIFMTAVLDPSVSGKTYQVFSVKEEYIDDLGLWTFFDCECNNTECKKCEYRNVRWRDTDWARDVNVHLRDLLAKLLIVEPGGETGE